MPGLLGADFQFRQGIEHVPGQELLALYPCQHVVEPFKRRLGPVPIPDQCVDLVRFAEIKKSLIGRLECRLLLDRLCVQPCHRVVR